MTPSATPISPPEKFLRALREQLAVAENPNFTKRAKVFRINKETKKGATVETDVKVKSWVRPSKNGAVILQLKYGNQPVFIGVPEVIRSLMEAVAAGELNGAVEAAANAARAKFKAHKKTTTQPRKAA